MKSKILAILMAFSLMLPSLCSSKIIPPAFVPDMKDVVESKYKTVAMSVVKTAVIIKVHYSIVEDDKVEVKSYLGSGVIISTDGYILSCGHLFEGVPDIIKITYMDSYFMNRTVSAKLIAVDHENDLSLLKVIVKNPKTLDMQAAKFAKEMQVGEEVIAIGNPYGFMFTVTNGIISGVGRTVGNRKRMLQTTALIAPGNSGGPLFDMNGNIVGINVIGVADENAPWENFSVSGFTCLDFINLYRHKII